MNYAQEILLTHNTPIIIRSISLTYFVKKKKILTVTV